MIAATLVIAPAQAALNRTEGSARPSDFLVHFAITGALALWVLRQCSLAGVSPRALLGPEPSTEEWSLTKLVIPLVPLALGSIWLIWLPISYAMPEFVQNWILKEDPQIWSSGAPIRSVMAIVIIVFAAPVVEEFVFRGVLLQRFATKWSAGNAILVSSLLFGVLHADVLGKTIFGLVMAWLYVRTSGLWVPIACHVLNNAIAVTMSLVPWFADQREYTLQDFQRDWYVGAIALGVSVVVLFRWRDRFLPAPGWRLPVPSAGSVETAASA